MINFLAISYHNIGPIKNKFLTIFFGQGKYLIKGPIGTGKSFLFFDGPIYALYKYSKRNMLNNQSKNGFIKLLFEQQGQIHLVVRKLCKTKSKESCTSTLYQIENETYQIQDTQIIEGDIENILKDQNIKMQEIAFKNEIDLQQNLNSFLPPKEVFLNTVFLMQDSDNIFELQAADRLNVLKNVFNLLGIDEAKEKISERKKEIWYKLKASSDTSKYDEKLKKLLSEYLSNYKTLTSFFHCHSNEKNNFISALSGIFENESSYVSFFQNLENLYEKLNISEFSLEDFPLEMHQKIDLEIENLKSEYQKLNHQLQTLISQHKEEEEKILSYQKNIKQLHFEIEQFTSKIKYLDPNAIQTLKQEKKNLIIQEENEIKKIQYEKINEFYLKFPELFKDYKKHDDVISNAYFFVQYLKNVGKNFAQEIEKIQIEIKHYTEMLQNYEEQFQLQEKKIKIFEEDIEKKAHFDCPKIATNCPFIKIINKQTFEQFEKQQELLKKEKIDLEKKMQGIKEILNTLPQKNNLTHKQKMIEIIKLFLNEINRKSVETIYETFQGIQTKKKNIDLKINNLESEIEKLEHYKNQILTHQIEIKNIEKIIEEIQGKIKNISNEEEKLNKELNAIPYQDLLQGENTHTKMKENYRDIVALVHEFKEIQIQIKHLQEEEEIVNNLYLILSKELLLLILQDHLPILSDIINTYLAQVVDYQINFSLKKTNNEKLELLAQIFDEKGSGNLESKEREVKSLSGGQKIILKIVWMLAISSYIRSPLLFIDETINNLDADTVGKVSDMLENFVKSKNMKLYAVTHNQQIQDMKFWDKIIEL